RRPAFAVAFGRQGQDRLPLVLLDEVALGHLLYVGRRGGEHQKQRDHSPLQPAGGLSRRSQSGSPQRESPSRQPCSDQTRRRGQGDPSSCSRCAYVSASRQIPLPSAGSSSPTGSLNRRGGLGHSRENACSRVMGSTRTGVVTGDTWQSP